MNIMRLLPLVLFSVACSPDKSLTSDANLTGDTGRRFPDDTSDLDTGDTSSTMHPAWYVVRADLSIVGGVASAEGASVAIDVIDEDLERLNCVVDLAPDLVTAAEPDADRVWWTVPVRSLMAPCATLPDTIELGVGSLHPDVRARLGTVGHDDIADSLYGAWLRVDEGDITVFGYAGTVTDLMGDDAATLPPPDGLYRLAPLYVVALPD